MLSTMTASATPATGRHPVDSVQRLMDAAVDAFADKGFHATSTRDIAARANMSPAGVYVHFASKQDLLFQLCQRGHVLALDIVTRARDTAQAPPAQLVAIVSAFARWHAEQYRTARIVQYEFPHLTPRTATRSSSCANRSTPLSGTSFWRVLPAATSTYRTLS